MGLDSYKKKRNFEKTPEPQAVISRTGRQRYVVQRHQASRLHYDLRLEMDGVLKSWAIPKGPSMNPADKRLAIRTEDHPVKYLDFEGDIPKGNYGAGHMQIWDHGTYTLPGITNETEALKQLSGGELKMEFSGSRLRGHFVLVKTSSGQAKDNWLLIKKSDEYATELKFDAEDLVAASESSGESQINPGTYIKPMLAGTAQKIFNDPDWLFELKWDGYRLMAHLTGSGVHLHSRNGISYTDKFDRLARELEALEHSAILDGEVVLLDEDGKALFSELQNYPGTGKGILRFYVFDILYLNGYSLTQLPLKDRKSLIPQLLEGLEYCKYCDHIEGMGISLYDKAIGAGIEGVVAKQAQSFYFPGHRTEQWLKVKKEHTVEAFICGYTESSKNPATFGSLILGKYEDAKLVYLGNCGSGFSAEDQRKLLELFLPLKTDSAPFSKVPDLKGRLPQWLQPRLQCEVKYSSLTKKGLLRHPVFKRLRHDLNPKLTDPGEVMNRQEKVTDTGDVLEVNGRPVALSNLDKLYWPETGLRKYDLIDYYIKLADYILPYLSDRPENLHRHPNGITEEGFYQKDMEGLPSWIRTFRIYSKSSDRNIDYLICDDQATLIYLANLGCIELNPWNSKTLSLDWPDYCVIDLDPSPQNTFENVVESALMVKQVLDMAAIEGYCKTSGSRGLHIYIPMGARYTYEECRDFARVICFYVQQALPELTTLERKVNKRDGKIYLDYLQNRRGQSMAAAYCVRPKPDAPVSMPVSWAQVKKGFSMRDFTILTVPSQIEQADSRFREVLHKTIDMSTAILNLQNHVL